MMILESINLAVGVFVVLFGAIITLTVSAVKNQIKTDAAHRYAKKLFDKIDNHSERLVLLDAFARDTKDWMYKSDKKQDVISDKLIHIEQVIIEVKTIVDHLNKDKREE